MSLFTLPSHQPDMPCLPAEVLGLVFCDLLKGGCFSTLANVSTCSKLYNSVATPLLYETLKLRDDADYTRLLDTYEHHQDLVVPVRLSPLIYIKHIQVHHFPSVPLGLRISSLAQTAQVLGTVSTLTFTLQSCHSILWGPMYHLRHPLAASHPESGVTGQEMIAAFSRLASPKALCVHLNHYSVFDRDWNLFFRTVCEPWSETLKSVNVHGMEYWLKAFAPGIKHSVFLDVGNVPYRPGTGLMVAQDSREARAQCVDTWAEVLLSMVQDGYERDREHSRVGSRTSWTLHLPGARLQEIIESEEALLGKLARRCPEAHAEVIAADPPIFAFETDKLVACNVCKGEPREKPVRADPQRLPQGQSPDRTFRPRRKRRDTCHSLPIMILTRDVFAECFHIPARQSRLTSIISFLPVEVERSHLHHPS
jgi:hypothetical protein